MYVLQSSELNELLQRDRNVSEINYYITINHCDIYSISMEYIFLMQNQKKLPTSYEYYGAIVPTFLILGHSLLTSD